jgi:S1-C subfamily serine protease
VVDILIILFLISALFRGREIGLVQQLCSTVGFFGGLLLGAMLEPHTVQLAHTPVSRTFVTLGTTLGSAFLFLAIGEYIGIVLKHKVEGWRINTADNVLGSVLSGISVLVAVWLGAAILMRLPYPGLQQELRKSRIVSSLTNSLPAAPGVIAGIGHLIDPNGFPDVFIGSEPNPPDKINLPSSSALAAAVSKDKASVVKVEGKGCGGIVEGSGFVVGANIVATNAHVIAGIHNPVVKDANGIHTATPIWFDPDLDFAVLRVSNLAGEPLVFNTSHVADNTPAAVLGYPGGGGFVAEPASVLDEFTANGRNIYNQGRTERQIYEIAANIIPGNSGGPVVDKEGGVIAIVFAESTSYDHVGYALTPWQPIEEIAHASAQNRAVSTGTCAE